MESADVVLMKSDPYDVVGAIELSRATLRKMHQNLWWAVGYNVIAISACGRRFLPLPAESRDRRPSDVWQLGPGRNQCAHAQAHQAGWHHAAWHAPAHVAHNPCYCLTPEAQLREPNLTWRAFSAILLVPVFFTNEHNHVLPS
jgi:hypothetical protein